MLAALDACNRLCVNCVLAIMTPSFRNGVNPNPKSTQKVIWTSVRPGA